jgi:hypothetical protein
MTIFSDLEVEKKLALVLDQASLDGEVRIKRADGQEYVLRPAARSPLDVGFVNVQPPLTVDDIVQAIQDGRDRHANGDR